MKLEPRLPKTPLFDKISIGDLLELFIHDFVEDDASVENKKSIVHHLLLAPTVLNDDSRLALYRAVIIDRVQGLCKIKILADINCVTDESIIDLYKDELLQAVIRMHIDYTFLPLATIACSLIERDGAHTPLVDQYLAIIDSYKAVDLIELGLIRRSPIDVDIYNWFMNQDSSSLLRRNDLEIVKLFSLIQEILK